MKSYYLILIVSSLSILYFIPNIYPENDSYPNKHISFVTFSDFQYENIFLDYNKMLKVVLTNSSFEKDCIIRQKSKMMSTILYQNYRH